MKILILVLCFLSATLTLRIEHKKASHKSSLIYLIPLRQLNPHYQPPSQGSYIPPNKRAGGLNLKPFMKDSGYHQHEISTKS